MMIYDNDILKFVKRGHCWSNLGWISQDFCLEFWKPRLLLFSFIRAKIKSFTIFCFLYFSHFFTSDFAFQLRLPRLFDTASIPPRLPRLSSFLNFIPICFQKKNVRSTAFVHALICLYSSFSHPSSSETEFDIISLLTFRSELRLPPLFLFWPLSAVTTAKRNQKMVNLQ